MPNPAPPKPPKNPDPGTSPTPTPKAQGPATVTPPKAPLKPGDPGFVGPVAAKQEAQTKPKVNYIPAVSAVDRAKLQVGSDEFSRYCQKYVENSILDHGGVYDSASDYLNWAKDRNAVKMTAPPAGVPVFYAGSANNDYGHVAISAGDGYIYSTDAQGHNTGKVKYDELWGGTGSGKYLGWTSVIRNNRDGGDVSYIDYDSNSVGNAQNINTEKPASSSSQTGTGDAVKPAPVPAPPPVTQPVTSASDRGMFGSLFGSIFGSMSRPSSTVAQKPATPSTNPGISTQFDSHIPTMSELGTTSSTTSLDSAGDSENVTVEPVGG